MTQDSGAHGHDDRHEPETSIDQSAEHSQPPPTPFLLLPGDEPTAANAPAGDSLTRLARILEAARSDPTLAGPLRLVTSAWLDDGGWQVGLGFVGEPDELGSVAVAELDRAEGWREAVEALEPQDVASLLSTTDETVPSSDLPDALAAQAAVAGTDRADVFPIEADGRVIGVAVMLRAAAAAPEPGVRRAMEISRHILSQIASRVRARTAVAGAARHIRRLSAAEAGSDGGRATELEQRYELLCRGAESGLWDWDLEGDSLHLSPRWTALLGYGAEELSTQPSEWLDRIHPDDSDRVELELLEHLDGASPRFESEHRILHGDGSHRWVRVRGVAERDAAGKAVRVAGSMVDVSESREQDDRTTRDLLYHRLTGFPIAALLNDRIEQAMRRRVRRPDRSFAVLALALEGFRQTADRVGLEATEEILLTVGRRISNAIRPGDTVAHVEDLQFGVVLDDVKSLEDATRVADRILQELSQDVPLGSEQVTLKPALGLALSRTAYETPDEMVRDARIALRRARREQTPLQVFDSATKAFAQSIVELEGDLRKAFEARELFLEYQPVVSLSDGRITGVEAYLRWNHPERGPIAPSEFLPVAEEAGLIQDVGYWVLDRACRQMKQWIDDYNLRFPPNIAINLSEAQLFDEAFVPRTLETIEGSGLEPKLVRLDISEGTFMKDGPAAGRILRALAQRGIRIAVDDFGTGYSSLSYLHRYPIGALKIDRSFVSGASGQSNQWDVARTIVELAKILELEVIAEGIENREQFLQLRALGCQQAQGFFFSGPASANKTARLIEGGYPLDLATSGT